MSTEMQKTSKKPLSNGSGKRSSQLGRATGHGARVGEEKERQVLVCQPGGRGDQEGDEEEEGDRDLHLQRGGGDYFVGGKKGKVKKTSLGELEAILFFVQ